MDDGTWGTETGARGGGGGERGRVTKVSVHPPIRQICYSSNIVRVSILLNSLIRGGKGGDIPPIECLLTAISLTNGIVITATLIRNIGH